MGFVQCHQPMTITDPTDILRSRYLAEIADLDKRRAAIQAKMNMLEEVIRDLRDAENQNTFAFTKEKKESIPGSLTEAVIWTVDRMGTTDDLTTAEVREFMLKSGFKPGGAHFNVALFKTLTRLVDSNRIMGEKKDGSWRFRSTQSLLK